MRKKSFWRFSFEKKTLNLKFFWQNFFYFLFKILKFGKISYAINDKILKNCI